MASVVSGVAAFEVDTKSSEPSAFFTDYRNARPKYVEAFWTLVNWDFVAANFA